MGGGGAGGMICPKCGGQSVFPAMNEAPDGARDWRKCMSCGKRWNPLTDDDVETIKRAFDEWQPGGEGGGESGGEDGFDAEDRRIAREHADAFDELDLMDEPVASPTDLAMTDVLIKRGRKKKEKEPMPKFVSEEHRARWMAGQKLSRQLKQEADGGGQGNAAKRKPGRPKKLSAPVVSVPAMREPEALPAPRPVGQRGDVLSILDSAIVSAHADVQALERVRAILSRQSA
jgi:hypothetical protein